MPAPNIRAYQPVDVEVIRNSGVYIPPNDQLAERIAKKEIPPGQEVTEDLSAGNRAFRLTAKEVSKKSLVFSSLTVTPVAAESALAGRLSLLRGLPYLAESPISWKQIEDVLLAPATEEGVEVLRAPERGLAISLLGQLNTQVYLGNPIAVRCLRAILSKAMQEVGVEKDVKILNQLVSKLSKEELARKCFEIGLPFAVSKMEELLAIDPAKCAPERRKIFLEFRGFITELAKTNPTIDAWAAGALLRSDEAIVVPDSQPMGNATVSRVLTFGQILQRLSSNSPAIVEAGLKNLTEVGAQTLKAAAANPNERSAVSHINGMLQSFKATRGKTNDAIPQSLNAALSQMHYRDREAMITKAEEQSKKVADLSKKYGAGEGKQ